MKNYLLPSLSAGLLLAFPMIASAAPTFSQLTNSPGSGAFNIWLMTDGTVLAQLSSDGKTLSRLTPDAHGRYFDGQWSSAGSFSVARLGYASQVLSNGKLVVCGGEYTPPDVTNPTEAGSCEVYDPITRTPMKLTPPANWSNIGDAPSTVLPDGTMILGGTQGQTNTQGISQEAVLNPQTLGWTFTTGDQQSEQGYALLQTGDVLTARTNSPASSRYNVAAGGFSADGPVPVVLYNSNREYGAGVTLMDGRVLWLGITGSTAIYTAKAGQNGNWVAGPLLPKAPSGDQLWEGDAHAILEPNGNVLAVVAGNNSPDQFVEYVTSSNTFVPVPGAPSGFPGNGIMGATGGSTVMLVLPDGTGLVALSGGQWYSVQFGGTGQGNWVPKITNAPLALIVGTEAVITGTQLCGLSEVTDDSDDGQNAENYPIVSVASNSYFGYLRTHDVTSRSIAPGQVASVTIDIPSNLSTNGSYEISTYAMGFQNAWGPPLLAVQNFLPAVLSLLLDD
jgi:hypothetical protein